MNIHDIELPPEFQSGNSVPVERATFTRERMQEVLEAYANARVREALEEFDLQSQERENALEAENVKLREALEVMVEMVEMKGFGMDYAMDVARTALAARENKS